MALSTNPIKEVYGQKQRNYIKIQEYAKKEVNATGKIYFVVGNNIEYIKKVTKEPTKKKQ